MSTLPFVAIVLLWPVPDPPPLTDLRWFPPADMAERNWLMGLGHRDWIDRQAEFALCERDYWDDCRRDARWCNRAWDLLDNAHRCHMNDIEWRRGELAKLRDMIGWEAYYQGRMPPPLPVWRMPRID